MTYSPNWDRSSPYRPWASRADWEEWQGSDWLAGRPVKACKPPPEGELLRKSCGCVKRLNPLSGNWNPWRWCAPCWAKKRGKGE